MGSGPSKTASTTVLKECTLWKADRSPACRAVMMALDAMRMNITEVDLNMDKQEHKAPDITSMTKLHTLPILKDRELILWDSHAISTYLATRYCCTDNIIPKGAGARALLDQLMIYNGAVLQPRYYEAANPILYEGCRFIMPQQVCNIENAYSDLEDMIGERIWFGGCWITLADIALVATVSTLNVLVPVDKKRYPKLSSWLFRMSEEMFYHTANKKGLEEFSRRIGEFKHITSS